MLILDRIASGNVAGSAPNLVHRRACTTKCVFAEGEV